MDSGFIIKSLKNRFSHNKLNISNAFIYLEESDFLTITRENLTHEIEVKISRSDFKADFIKRKHKFFKEIIKGNSLVTFRGSEDNATCDISHIINPNTRSRFRAHYQTPKEWYCSISIQKVNKTSFPNKFSFAVPEGLIKSTEIPENYGLYYVLDSGEIKEIKRAKFIHKEKFVKWEDVAMKFYYKQINLK